MRCHTVATGVVLSVLEPEPNTRQHLKDLRNIRDDCDLILDFQSVETLSTLSIIHLLFLLNMMIARHHELVLVKVCPEIKGIFQSIGIIHLLNFAENVSTAVKRLK